MTQLARPEQNIFIANLIGMLFTLCFCTFAAIAAANPITDENLNPGSREWKLSPGWDTAHAANDSIGQIKGYLSATSVNKGGQIDFKISVNPAQNFTIEIYRAGWYGGNGGRHMQTIGPIAGITQPACGPLATPSDVLEECNWSTSYTFNVPETWTSGIYLAKLKNASGYDSGAIFVVRDDTRVADYLYKQPVHTYQAYNDYPSQRGKSLYTATKGYKISYNRPYAGSPTNTNGYGDYIFFELELVKWLEKEGYDVTYTTDVDFPSESQRLPNFKALISPGHDEYWTKEIRDGFEAARDNGVNLAFFGANVSYFQVRMENSPIDQSPNRTLVCYKSSVLDPIQNPALKTDLFRSTSVARPEQQMMGVQFGTSNALGRATTYTNLLSKNTTNWVYRGSGIVDGQSFPGLVGYEIDFNYANYPSPQSTEHTLIAESPFLSSTGLTLNQQSVVFKTPQGGWVFASGTMAWSWALDYDISYPTFAGDKRSPALQIVTKNIMNRFGGYNDAPGGQPVIDGLAQEDQTLSVDMSGVSDNNGLGAFSYQWQRNGLNIVGATSSSFTLGNADVNNQIRIVASYTDGWDKPETVTSAPTQPVANVNDLPSGQVNINGNPAVGSTLTASNNITDADGLGTISYQWQRNGTDITGANTASFLLTSVDGGAQIAVIAKYTDGHGTQEQVASAALTINAATNHPPAGLPVVTGLAQENQTLSANTSGVSDSDGLGQFSYQWQRNGINLPGANGLTYTLGDADVGGVISLVVSYTDGLGKIETLVSASTAAVLNVNDLPAGNVTINGIANIGQALTAANNLTDSDGMGIVSYQWRRNGTNITGATANTYVLVAADAGSQISVAASYVDGFGTTERVVSANVNIPVFLGIKRLQDGYFSRCSYPSSSSENARLYVTTCSSATNQKWNIEQINSTTFKLTNQSTGRVVAVNNGSTSNGATVVQQTFNAGANHQLWNIQNSTGSSFNLINKKSGRCLSVDTLTRGLVQRTCSTSSTMRWNMIN